MKTRLKISWSRIDYFLISENLINVTSGSDIVSCIHSDHSAVTVDININDRKRGPGTWKFNNTFLKDDQFVEEITNLIQGVSRVYEYMNPIDRWEVMKKEIIEFSKKYGVNKSYNSKSVKFNLCRILEELQMQIVKGCPSKAVLCNIENIKSELDSYDTADAKKAAFRCKLNWNQYSEHPSEFFFNMERRNFTKKSMYMA